MVIATLGCYKGKDIIVLIVGFSFLNSILGNFIPT